jgi:hypothetical protein
MLHDGSEKEEPRQDGLVVFGYDIEYDVTPPL